MIPNEIVLDDKAGFVKLDINDEKFLVIHLKKEIKAYTKIVFSLNGKTFNTIKDSIRILGFAKDELLKKIADQFGYDAITAYYYHYEKNNESKLRNEVPKLDGKIIYFNGKFTYNIEKDGLIDSYFLENIKSLQRYEKIKNGLKKNTEEEIKKYQKRIYKNKNNKAKKELDNLYLKKVEDKGEEFKRKFIIFLENQGFIKVKRPKIAGSKEYTKIIRLNRKNKKVMVSFRILPEIIEYRIDNKLESILQYNIPEVFGMNDIENIFDYFKKNGRLTNPPKYK